MKNFIHMLQKVVSKLDEKQWLGTLFIRISVGTMFCGSGFRKLFMSDVRNDLIKYFKYLQIPAAGIQAPMVASIEFFCGMFVILGLGTRISAFLLANTMVVALLTAKLAWLPPGVTHPPEAVLKHGLIDFFYLPEWLLLVCLTKLIFTGCQHMGIDVLLRAKLFPAREERTS
jgi:putative oxidoreductase